MHRPEDPVSWSTCPAVENDSSDFFVDFTDLFINLLDLLIDL